MRARPVAPTLRSFSVFFVYFRLKSGRVIKLAICVVTPETLCLIYFVKRASGNIWCIDRESESRSGGHYARFRIVRRIAEEFIELNDNSCGYFVSCN